MHAKEVTELKTHLQKVEEECRQRHEENAWQVEEMKKMVEELT